MTMRRGVLLVLILGLTVPVGAQVRLRFRTTVVTLQAHPRIWLTSQMQTDLAAKSGAADADWLTLKAAADAFLVQAVPRITVTAATNASPVSFTVSGTVPWNTTTSLYIVGATGGWTGVNNSPVANAVTATKTSSTTFTIPVDTTAFGSFAGQTLTAFVTSGETSGFIPYGQTGSGWYDAALQLGLAYKVLGTSTYRVKALELLDWINELGAAGMIAPITQDTRRGTVCITALAILYDWFFADLSAGQKTASIVTGNLWSNDIIANAVYWEDPSSNYWQNHLTSIAAWAYASYDENGSAASYKTQADANWTTNFASKVFSAPSTSIAGYSSLQGYHYSGLAVQGYNYGGNDIARHVKYMLLVKSATGSLPINASTYATTWAQGLIYQVKPDRWKAMTMGQWTGSWFGLMTFSEALLLSDILDGTTAGAWMQWLYENQGSGRPGGADSFAAPTVQDRVMFYKDARTATDYTATETPYAFLDNGEATVVWRSDFTDTAQMAWFKVGSSHYSASTPKMAAHVDLTRGTDWVLPNIHYWKGADDGTDGSPTFALDSSAGANTLYFLRASDGEGPDGFDSAPGLYEGGQLGGFRGIYITPKVKVGTTYAYAEGEFSTIYDFSGTLAAKEVQYFFRAFVAAGHGVYVVWDRIKSSSGNDVKQIRWHLPGENAPAESAGLVSSVIGASKVYLSPLLPAAASISVARISSAPYRVIVTDPSPAQALSMLTAFYVTASATGQPTTTLLTSIDSNFVGVQVQEATQPKVVILPRGVTDTSSTFTSTAYEGSTFVTTHTGTARYIVAGLEAGNYLVQKDGSTIEASLTAGADGTVTFTSTAGDFTVTQL